MSGALLRRNSSKQGLQNLLRVTAQRSIEDAEEVERERRRRARESFRRASTSGPGGPSQDSGAPTEDGLYNGDVKPSSPPCLEEDEGFSDWTQRLEKRRQQRMEEQGQGQENKEKVVNGAARSPDKTPCVTALPPARLHKQNKEDEEMVKSLTQKDNERRGKGHSDEVVKEGGGQGQRKTEKETEKQRAEPIKVLKEENQRPDAGINEKRNEVKVSYTSKMFLSQQTKQNSTNGNAHKEEVTSLMVKTKKTPSQPSPASRPVLQAVDIGEADEAEAILETEQRLEKIRRSHQEKESQELEQLRQRQVEAEQELEELKRRRETRRGVRVEEERRREEEEQQRLAKEEEEKRRMKEDIERRRMEAAQRMKTLSTSGVDGDEIFSPLSPKGPTFKITERTESLNRSLKKSNSFKKTQPPVLLSKIDDKMEQYTHAIETSQEAKAAKQGLTDILSPPEAVASKKNLFETGEVRTQSPTKGTPCKDAEGLKVGVADLITQWVKGNPDGSGKQSPTKPSDVRPGDVMQKKNLWEIIGDTSSGKHGQGAKGTPSGKRYKFVVTGHGKYEKFPADDDDGNEYTNGNGKSDMCPGDY